MEPAVEPHARFIVADLVDGGLVGLGRRDGGEAIAIFPHEAGHSAGEVGAIGCRVKLRSTMATEVAMAQHFHAVVWVDHKQARIFHFNVDDADKTVIRDHVVRDLHAREKVTGHRIEENKPFFEEVAKAIADAGAILIVGPAQEKDFFAKFLADKHPAIRTHVEGVEKADHPTDGELIDHARRFVKAADRMRR
jgi:hypothetical protein